MGNTAGNGRESDRSAAGNRDSREGRYTQAEPEGPEGRTVHGQYTESADNPGLDDDSEGLYVGTEGVGEREPKVGDTHARHGNYPKAEHDATSSRPWSHLA